MGAFRVGLVVVIVSLAIYTGGVGFRHGWDLLPVFFGDIAAMTWPGQFNCDFLSFLALAGFWVGWRHRFSAGGLLLGVLVLFGGMLVFAPYLIHASFRAQGEASALLLGARR